MHIIPSKTPEVLKRLLPQYYWDVSVTEGKKIYLTFDDGPVPRITEFVLDQLLQYQAKATFFCLGNNIEKHPHLLLRIHEEKHRIGNHTQNHLSAWKTDTKSYLSDIQKCQNTIFKQCKEIFSPYLFRPPYGQVSYIKTKGILRLGYTIVLWDVLAKDWKNSITPEQCAKNVIKNARSGSIIVFHDSQKAWKNMSYALPRVLTHFSEAGYTFEVLPEM